MGELKGMRLKRLLSQMTLYDVEVSTGVQASTLSLLERGLRKPTVEQKRKLADFYHCYADELFV